MAEAAVQVLVENLTSLIHRQIGLILGVEKEMKKLSNTFATIQKVLEDAEDKQFQSKSIQNWLCQLNDLAFEIEDVLDECETEVFKMRRKAGNFSLKKILYKYKMGRRIRDAVEKLEAIAKDRQEFHLQETVVQQSANVDWRRETGSVVNEPDQIYGRDEERDKIVDLLLNQAKDCDQLCVLPIVGIGGMGKTTLAQLVFNDQRVGQHFEAKSWASVSDHFDLKAILKAVIESTTGVKSNLENLDSVQRSLRQVLNGKRYLLVLDDVWNEDQEDWFRLRSILACGSTGASIVVTTRLKTVADIMGTFPSHCLTELSEEHSWLLFRLRAFGQEKEQHPNLEAIGKRIVKKCAGVPLAAKALGGLLRFKREEKEWIRVEESHIRYLSEEEGTSIMPVLRLSYRHLPFVLKQCFVHCAVFPKDYTFSKTFLIFQWMAHGCISSNKTGEMEDVGDQIWKELALRSFFQEVNKQEDETTFKMHDLVHDLALSIMESKAPVEETSPSCSKIREAHLTTRPKARSTGIAVEVASLNTIMINYNRVRILKLINLEEMEELPAAIGKLKHLRFLDLSGSSIRALPHTLCRLVNLKILNLNYCSRLKRLPKNMNCMTNIRHILLEGCRSMSHMPYRTGELVSLKTLSLYVVGDKKGNQLDELEHLNLGGRLEIKHLERVPSHMNAKKANLVEKSNLRDLLLCWGGDTTSTELTKMKDDEKVIEALEPCINIATLQIRGFKGRELALWMNKMSKLTWIYMENCRNCRHLLPLGDLPLLESLHLRDFDVLEYIVEENEVDATAKFPSLKYLVLDSLPNLKGWLKKAETREMFPNLQILSISWCESLISTSNSLSSTLKNLKELECSPLILPSFTSKFKNLSFLELDFSEIYDTTMFSNIPENALEGLGNLKRLIIGNASEHCLPHKWSQCLTSLTQLEIQNSRVGRCFSEGWLRHLTALEDLSIEHCSEFDDVVEDMKHLHLFKHLTLENVDDVISLPHGLQHISSLQSLSLRRLDRLTSLPDWLPELTSLTRLAIDRCPAIPSLPSTIQGMTNLKSLQISRCPQLEKRCEKPDGEDWHKIAHISNLDIGI